MRDWFYNSFNNFVWFKRAILQLQDFNLMRMMRRVVLNGVSSAQSASGFTLIELVMVIAIVGILASLSLPKFIDMSGAAKESATKGGLGALRSALAIRYAASATGGATASYPTAMSASDFGNGTLPKNALNNFQVAPTSLAATVNGTATHATTGFWFVTAAGNDYGKAGAYSDGTVNTQTY